MDNKQDLYAVLGVTQSASQDEIRAAYRRLAKQSHPDLHPGDKTAEEKFKTVSAANDVLSDEEKRGRYDRGEIDSSGAEVHPQGSYKTHADTGAAHHYQSKSGYGDFADMGDVFADIFSQQGGQNFSAKGHDTQYTLGVDFLDAVTGTKARVTMPDGQSLDVSIPPGTKDGQALRLKGKGQPGLGGGDSGDALVVISVRPNAKFKRQKNDILIDVPISLPEAVLGGRIQVPTVSGLVTMSVPQGTSTDTTLRLKGKGVQTKVSTGDQLVTLKIVLPDTIDPELEAFMTTWQETHAYDPRKTEKEAA
jgi:DnaJ-class molecular chaperone